MGGVMTKLVDRNTTIPTRKSEIFSTAEDNQTAVDIYVFQGERPMARDNKLLGNFRLDGIPPAKRSGPKVEVTFDIDANGIMNVTARDQSTGKEQKITITASTNLSKDDVDKLVKEADLYAQEDRVRKEEADLHNEADSLAYSVARLVKDLGDHISAGEKARAEMLSVDLKQKIKDNADRETIKGIMNELRGMLVILQQAAARGQEAQASEAAQGGPVDAGEVDTEVDANLSAAANDSIEPVSNGENGGSAGVDNSQAEYTAATSSNPDESIDAEFRQSPEE
jgi:molecular chaperone DnaK